MGLGDITPSKESGSPDTSSSGSSTTSRMTLSGVSPGDFPVTVAKTPYLIIAETDEGYEDIWYPETPELNVEYSWYGEFDYLPNDNWCKVFWTEDQFNAFSSRVEKHLELDLKELIKEDTQEGVRALRATANDYLDLNIDETVDCAVCSEALHPRYDDTEMVNNRRVCVNHTVTELKQSGLIE